MLTFRATGCCGIQELTELSSHPTPEDAMDVFCGRMLRKIRKVAYLDRVLGDCQLRQSHLYSFYLFTAAVYDPGKGGRPYGQNFAEYIKAHRLGQVTTLPARPNYAFHPDHKVQAWLWKPSLSGMKKWYQVRLDAAEAIANAKHQAAQERHTKALREAREAAAQLPPPAVVDRADDEIPF